jgi:hypothetical protein
MRIKFTILNSSQIKDMINENKTKVKTKLKDAMVKFAVEEIVIGGYNKLTSDRHVLTGRLRQSIYAKYNKKYCSSNYLIHKYIADVSGESFTGRIIERAKDLEVLVGTDVPYAAKIEFLYDSYLFTTFEYSKQKLIPVLQRAIRR